MSLETNRYQVAMFKIGFLIILLCSISSVMILHKMNLKEPIPKITEYRNFPEVVSDAEPNTKNIKLPKNIREIDGEYFYEDPRGILIQINDPESIDPSTTICNRFANMLICE